MLCPIPAASGRAVGTLVPSSSTGTARTWSRTGSSSAGTVNKHRCSARLVQTRAGQGVGKLFLVSVGVFPPPPAPVIYKLIELLMKLPAIRASMVHSQLCRLHFPRFATWIPAAWERVKESRQN